MRPSHSGTDKILRRKYQTVLSLSPKYKNIDEVEKKRRLARLAAGFVQAKPVLSQ